MRKKSAKKIRLSNAQIVTIITALISLVSVGMVTYFQYVLPSKIMIDATKAAGKATTTMALPTQATQLELEKTTTPTSILPGIPQTAWQDIVKLNAKLGNYCDMGIVFPDNIDPSVDPVRASSELDMQDRSGQTRDWISAPVIGTAIRVEISGQPGNRVWVKLDNTAHVTITVDTNIPDHVNVVWDCAGAGKIRNFPPVVLETNYKEYTIDTSYPDADFFTLQAGEPEVFRFNFNCMKPGAYQVSVNVPFEYDDKNGSVPLVSHTLLCPKTFTLWSTLVRPNVVVSMGNYEWNGSEYIKTSQ